MKAYSGIHPAEWVGFGILLTVMFFSFMVNSWLELKEHESPTNLALRMEESRDR